MFVRDLAWIIFMIKLSGEFLIVMGILIMGKHIVPGENEFSFIIVENLKIQLLIVTLFIGISL